VTEDSELSPEAREYLDTLNKAVEATHKFAATPKAAQDYLETIASANEAAKRQFDAPREAAREYLQAMAPNPNPSPWINTPTDQPIRISEGSTGWDYPREVDGTVSFPLSLLFDTVRAASASPPREAAQPPGRYITKYDFVVDLGEDAGSEFLLTVHLGFREEDKEVVCVGIDLRSFAVFPEPTGPVGLPLQHLTAARLRSLRLGDYAEQAINSCRMLLRAIADNPESPIEDTDRPEIEQLIGSRVKPRGRPPALTDAQLHEFVVEAYLSGGRQKAELVRQSLQASGLLPPLTKGGEVEIQQARKQIDRARKRGLLPKRSRQTMNDQSGRDDEATAATER
jgi:hypothetical protein